MSTVLAATPWSTLIATGVALILVGVVGATIRAILTGQLVPRSVLEDEKSRADKWETAWRASEERADLWEGRFTALTEATELHTSLLSALVERTRR